MGRLSTSGGALPYLGFSTPANSRSGRILAFQRGERELTGEKVPLGP